LSRAGIVDAPWSAAVWPILGSMFMFRLVLYVMASRTDSPDRRPWWSLAYFFMLPNLVFPLFPVVDYQSFRRTHYDKDAGSIYDLGLLWVARGLVHLVLYRFVYHTLVIEPESVVTLGDLVHFMLATSNCPLAEYVVFYGPNDTAPPPVLLGAPVPEQGRLRPPDRPGAGVELDCSHLH